MKGEMFYPHGERVYARYHIPILTIRGACVIISMALAVLCKKTFVRGGGRMYRTGTSHNEIKAALGLFSSKTLTQPLHGGAGMSALLH